MNGIDLLQMRSDHHSMGSQDLPADAAASRQYGRQAPGKMAAPAKILKAAVFLERAPVRMGRAQPVFELFVIGRVLGSVFDHDRQRRAGRSPFEKS